MRKTLVILFSLTISIAPIGAQEPIPRPRVVKPATTVKPTPTPRRSLGEILFGKKETPKPTPAPVATPKPKPRQRPRQKAAPEEAATTPEEPKTDAEPAEKSVTKPKTPIITAPEPGAKPDAEPKAEPKPEEPKSAKSTKGRKPKPEKPAKPDTAGMDDSTKFKTLKALALEDAQVKELKAKADNAVDDADAHRASVAYNKALFRKIRELDPSIGDYSEKIEQSMMKRLSGEKHGE